MSFTFNNAVPAAANDPSVDQPDMLINNQSTNSILAIDHISFNTAGGGQHKQVTFNNKNTPGAQTDPQSVLYTASGTASTVSQMLYANQNGTFQISAVRAWAAGVNGTLSPPPQSYNVTSITRTSNGHYSVILQTNAVSSNNFAVVVNCSLSAAAGNPFIFAAYSITGTGTFNIVFGRNDIGFADPSNFSFIVLQI